MNHKISYLIPSYNHQEFIIDVLTSIKCDIQLLDPQQYEVIIIDDGSTDESPAKIKNWIDSNPKINIKFIARNNCGVTTTLNQLLELSRGEYIRLCSSDDCFSVGSSQQMRSILESDATLDCIIGDAYVVDEKGEPIAQSSIVYHKGRPHILKDRNKIHKELLLNWCLAGPSSLIRKSFFEQYFSYNESETIDDYDLYINLCAKKAILFIDIKTCNYKIHTSNTSKTQNTSKRLKNYNAFLSIIERNLAKVTLYPVLVAMKYLTKCKIYYMQRKYLGASFYFVLFKLQKLKLARTSDE